MFCLDIVDMVGWLAHKILETAQVETLNCWEFKFGLRHSTNFRKISFFYFLIFSRDLESYIFWSSAVKMTEGGRQRLD